MEGEGNEERGQNNNMDFQKVIRHHIIIYLPQLSVVHINLCMYIHL